MADHRAPLLSRRAVLLGGAGAVILAACGGNGDDDGDDAEGGAEGDARLSETHSLIQFFGNDVLVAGLAQRATFGIGDVDGVVTSDVPETLAFSLALDGDPVGDAISAASHAQGLPRPYYPLEFTLDSPGAYTASAEYQDGRVEAIFQVNDLSAVGIPQVGDPMIPLVTPTPADPRDVNPICTREPACPLHDLTLTEALTAGRPVALLISTPKFCQVAICGPVLDVLLSQQAAFPDVQMIHAEVYTDETTTTTTETVTTYGLTFEPCLFLAGSDGAVATRFDNIYDESELADALGRLT
jgi:hypothetical protein